jgi:hypothetical protein
MRDEQVGLLQVPADLERGAAPEPQPGLQGEGGGGRHQGREDAGRTGPAVRPASEPVSMSGALGRAGLLATAKR